MLRNLIVVGALSGLSLALAGCTQMEAEARAEDPSLQGQQVSLAAFPGAEQHQYEGACARRDAQREPAGPYQRAHVRPVLGGRHQQPEYRRHHQAAQQHPPPVQPAKRGGGALGLRGGQRDRLAPAIDTEIVQRQLVEDHG